MTKNAAYYRYQLSLDEEDKKTVDALIARGSAETFADAIRFCIREQQREMGL
jgi:hypothetical protein